MKLIGMTALALAASTALSGCAVLGVAQQAQEFTDKQNEVDSLSTSSTMPTTWLPLRPAEASVSTNTWR